VCVCVCVYIYIYIYEISRLRVNRTGLVLLLQYSCLKSNL